jgi:hypothetical protein
MPGQDLTEAELCDLVRLPQARIWALCKDGVIYQYVTGPTDTRVYKQEAVPTIRAHLLIEKLKPKKLDLEQLVGLAKVAEKPLIAKKVRLLRYPAASLEVSYWVEGLDNYRIQDSNKNLVFSHNITMDSTSEDPVEQLRKNLDYYKAKHGIEYKIV